MNKLTKISIIIPAKNEASAIAATIRSAREVFTAAGIAPEIIVVNDGSTDATASNAEAEGAMVINHPENLGYGAALKSGIRQASHDWIAITDADGTYPLDQFPLLLPHVPMFDMVVGARTGKYYEGGVTKQIARLLFRWLSEFVTGRRIPDINSGMRIFRRDFILSQWDHISSGFSFTTTLTLSMMLNGLFVKYVPISYHARVGKSHVRYWKDTLRSAQLIVQVSLWYNPIKLSLLLSSMALVLSLAAAVLVRFIAGYAAIIILVWAGVLMAMLFFALGALSYVCRHIATAIRQDRLFPQFGPMDRDHKGPTKE